MVFTERLRRESRTFIYRPQEDPSVAVEGWGYLPLLCVVAGCGLVLVALADNGGRGGAPWALLLYWIGLLVVFVPTAIRLFLPGPSSQERVGLVAMLGTALYLSKLMHSPLGFDFSDELAHLRTLNDILASGHLFQRNPLLVVSPLYPTLEVVVSAVMGLTGLSSFAAGALVLGVGHVILVVALYLLYEALSGSARVAGIAALLYMSNPNFIFFDSQFSYESLALPVAALALFALAHRHRARFMTYGGLTVVALLALATVITMHHMTSYVLTGFLLLWAVVAVIRRGAHHRGPLGISLLAAAACSGWLVFVAHQVIPYLAPVLSGAISGVLNLVLGETHSKALFQAASSAQSTPLLERMAALGSVAFLVLVLPFGLVLVWRRYRSDSLAVALGLAGLAYPATLALRLTPRGSETSNRASEFVFLGLAFVVALAIARLRPEGWRIMVAFGVFMAVVFAGGEVVGWAPWLRVPGPYLVEGDSRSIEPEGIAAAQWARGTLGPGNRVTADIVNRLLMASYGGQYTVAGYNDGVDVAPIYYDNSLSGAALGALRRGRVAYVVMDLRMGKGKPQWGDYVEGAKPPEAPLSQQALHKFDSVAGVSRVLDTGNILIYDVSGLDRQK